MGCAIGRHSIPAEEFVDISSVLVLLQERRLQFARSLPETPMLVKELQNYRTKTTQPTNDLIDIREGQNDDLVLALGLGCCTT